MLCSYVPSIKNYSVLSLVCSQCCVTAGGHSLSQCTVENQGSKNKALDMGVTTELVGAWGGMKGNVIKS